jgi:hypothetical protein
MLCLADIPIPILTGRPSYTILVDLPSTSWQKFLHVGFPLVSSQTFLTHHSDIILISWKPFLSKPSWHSPPMLADTCLLSWQICLSLSYPGRPFSHVLADIPLLNSRRHSSSMLVHDLFLFRLAFSHILAGILLRFQQTLLTCPGGHSLVFAITVEGGRRK